MASSKLGANLPLAMLAPRAATIAFRSSKPNRRIAAAPSTPLAWARVSTSAMAADRLMINALPKSLFAAARSLRSPWYSRRPVIAASSSLTVSKTAAGPATSIEPCALRAAAGVMNTGQCRYLSPAAASRCARSAVSTGSVVLWSISTASAENPAPAAAITSSTTASSFSTRCTRVAPPTASAGVDATRMPNRARARALSGERFQTVTVSPRCAAASAKAAPSNPVPRNAMFAMAVVLKN